MGGPRGFAPPFLSFPFLPMLGISGLQLPAALDPDSRPGLLDTRLWDIDFFISVFWLGFSLFGLQTCHPFVHFLETGDVALTQLYAICMLLARCSRRYCIVLA